MVPGQIQLPEPRNNTTTLHSLFAAQDVQRWYWSAVSFALISGHLLTDSWNPSLHHFVWLQQPPLTHLVHGTRFCLQHFVIEYIPIPVSCAWSDKVITRSRPPQSLSWPQNYVISNSPALETIPIQQHLVFILKTYFN